MISNTELKYLFKEKLDLSEWKKYSIKDDYAYGGVPIPGLRQEAYAIESEETMISVGVFYYHDVLTYIALVHKEAVHCAFHAPVSAEGKILEVRNGCPDVQPTKVSGVVTGFALDGVMYT